MSSLSVIHHPAYEVDIGPHVFPTAKYRLVRDRLVTEGTLPDDAFFDPAPASDDDIALVHTAEYLGKIIQGRLAPAEELLLEVPYSFALRDAMWLCAGGSIATARVALEQGLAFHLGGGFHHAFPDHGEGFCLINDVAVAVRRLTRDGAVHRALVIDLDVHHGNGTAAIFAREPAVFTFSMHQQHNYPAWKPPSDLDIGLEDRTDDATYLELLSDHLPRIVAEHGPDLAFYLAGADPYREDQLGGLGLTIEGLQQRDRQVMEEVRRAGVPLAVTLAGGYARRSDDTVEIHCNSVRTAVEMAATD